MFDWKIRIRIVFNVCRDTVSIPRDINGGNGCDETPHTVDGDQAIMTSESAPAFLIEKKGAASAACYRLGLQANQQKNMDVELYDVTDPAMGVNIKYTEGDYCCPYHQCESYQYRQKSLTVSFRCADARTDIPTMSSIETSNNGRLPYLSLNGPKKICPNARPIILVVSPNCTIDEWVEK